MDLVELNRLLKAEAKSVGLCDKWYSEWKNDETIDELLDKYIRGIDFVIDKNFPTNGMLKEFGGDRLHKHGIYIDEVLDEEADDSSVLVINGKCEGNVSYRGFSSGSIYLRGDSDITISVYNNARVSIEMYDNSRLRIINNGMNKSYIYKYGGQIHTQGDVLIHKRKKRD